MIDATTSVRSRAEIRPTPRANADLARRYSSAAQRSRSPKEATASRPAGRSRMPSRQTLNFPERHVHCDPGRAAPSPCQARTCRPRRRGWRRCTPRPGGPAPRPARLAPRPAAPATACRCRWAAAQQRRGAQGIAQAHCDPYLPVVECHSHPGYVCIACTSVVVAPLFMRGVGVRADRRVAPSGRHWSCSPAEPDHTVNDQARTLLSLFPSARTPMTTRVHTRSYAGAP